MWIFWTYCFGAKSKIIEKIHAWILVLWCWFFWKIFGGHLGQKNKIVEKIHAWIPTIPLMLRFSNTLDLRCHFAWWQYCTACALESCWWSYWELDGLANPWLKIETYWRKSKQKFWGKYSEGLWRQKQNYSEDWCMNLWFLMLGNNELQWGKCKTL